MDEGETTAVFSTILPSFLPSLINFQCAFSVTHAQIADLSVGGGGLDTLCSSYTSSRVCLRLYIFVTSLFKHLYWPPQCPRKDDLRFRRSMVCYSHTPCCFRVPGRGYFCWCDTVILEFKKPELFVLRHSRDTLH